MTLQEWERDIRNRQRNIVFPDTVLNEGRFYRNIASGKAVFSRGQKICLLLLFGYYLVIYALYLTGSIIEFLASKSKNPGLMALDILLSAPLLWGLLFWTLLTFKAFFSAQPVPKRRRGYRSGGS